MFFSGCRVAIISVSFFVAVASGCATQTPQSTSSHYYLADNDLFALKGKALSGDAIASLKIAQYYLFSKSGIDEPMFWFRLSAENGSLSAAINLAVLYQEDFHNDERAIYWYSKVVANPSYKKAPGELKIAANEGIAELLWKRGDFTRAIEYFRASAFEGSTISMRSQAEYYSDESHENTDLIEAYAWATLLKSRLQEGSVSFKDATTLVQEIGDRMSAADKQESLIIFTKYNSEIPIFLNR